MKKIIVIVTVFFSIIFCANADPAKKVNLTYQNGKLKIEAIHKVKDPKKHYIDQVIIKVDGKDLKTIPLKSQSSKDSEILELELDLKKGSKIDVSTRCNEFGIKKGKLTI